MAEKPGPTTVGKRMKEARLATAYRRRETVSQARMAELVGERIGRRLVQPQWSTYELDQLEPPLDVILATAELSGLTAGYIAFGPEEHAPLSEPLEPADAPERAAAAKKRRGA